MQYMNTRILSAQQVGQFTSTVWRVVVHHQHISPGSKKENIPQQQRQILTFVIGGNNDERPERSILLCCGQNWTRIRDESAYRFRRGKNAHHLFLHWPGHARRGKDLICRRDSDVLRRCDALIHVKTRSDTVVKHKIDQNRYLRSQQKCNEVRYKIL